VSGELPLHLLTAHQRRVVELVGRGVLFKTAAYELGISPSTVKVHMCNAYKVLGITNGSTELAYKLGRMDAQQERVSAAKAEPRPV
jgi:DNA-binding NarL/FixJ family response regulator